MTVRVGVTGAAGRMGAEVRTAVEAHPDCTLVFAVNRGVDDARADDESVIEPASAFETLLEEREPSVVIDFTGPDSALEYAEHCMNGRDGTGVPFVTGTTGFSDEQFARLESVSREIPLLHAPNFARGVQALVNLVSGAVEQLPGYDVEVVETHHNAKRDAPSGTAKRLLAAIESAGEFTERVHGRDGEQPREAGEIGVHAIRAGNVTGEHEIIIAGNHEEVRLTHRAEDRGVFAAGAVDAAVWLTGRDAGWYDFAEVIRA